MTRDSCAYSTAITHCEKKNPFVYDLANLERNLSLLMKIQVISNMFCYINIHVGALRKLIGANQMQTDSPLTRVNCYRK